MKRAIKSSDSKILSQDLKYKSKGDNSLIAKILLDEQKNFCAYTDEPISRTDAKDIEHFDPTIKDTMDDDYNNWFVVKHQWNLEKSYKWKKFQPALHPTDETFEDRIIYIDGDYMTARNNDLEANNTIKLLKLDDPGLAEKRKKYIARKRDEIEAAAMTAEEYFKILIRQDSFGVSYPRAIKETFDFDLFEML